MTLTTRSGKGSALTHAEMDANWSHLGDSANSSYTPSGTGATVRTVQSKLRETISFTDFGAVGDNSTDNLTAWTNALTAATGRRLFIPAGTYRIPFTATICSTPGANTVIEGEGSGNTTLIFVPSSTTDRTCIDNQNGGLVVNNLKIQLSVPTNGSCAIFRHAATGMYGTDCVFDGACTNSGSTISHTAYCVKLPTSGTTNDLDFFNCDFTRFRYPLLKSGSSTSADSRLSFGQCDFYNNYNEDLSFNSPLGSIDDVQVYSCRFRDGNGDGASVYQLYCAFASVSNFRVSGCSFQDTTGEAIHLEENCLVGVISGNDINVDTHTSGGSGAIQISDNNISGTSYMPQYITISGNAIKKSGTQQQADSIGINIVDDASAEVPAKNLTIVGNSISGFENGILSGATLDDGCVVSDNIADNCVNGFRGAFELISFNGNTSRGCTVGIYSANGGFFRNHTFINCTTNLDSVQRPAVLVDPSFSFPEFSIGAGAVVRKALTAAGAGDRAYGFISTELMCETAADSSSNLDEITWDGTTFTRTNKITLEGGGAAVTTETNGGNIVIKCFSGTARTTYRLSARLRGHMTVAV